jgi:hypothetical protein
MAILNRWALAIAFLGITCVSAAADTITFTDTLTTDRNFAVFHFSINAQQYVQLDTFGSSFDTILGLYSGSGNLATYNDDCDYPSSYQSCLSMSLYPGNYFASVSSYANQPPNALPQSDVLSPNFGYYVGSFILNINGVDSAGVGRDFNTSVAVPEPTTLMLMATGLIALFGFKRVLERIYQVP